MRPQTQRRQGQRCRRGRPVGQTGARSSLASNALRFTLASLGIVVVTAAQPAGARLAGNANAGAASSSNQTVSGTVTVFAAASLRSAFTEIATSFRKANPKAKVTFQFAGSSTLVTQLRNGAQADVIASADRKSLDKLKAAGLLGGPPVVFARNSLAIVVPKGNPQRVKALADFGRPKLVFAIGAPGVPVGDYARSALQRVGVTANAASLESNVQSIVAKAELGEIDAGIVYRTDIRPGNKQVEGVVIPTNQNVLTEYPAAAVKESANRAGGQGFIQFLKSSAALNVLKKHNFLSP